MTYADECLERADKATPGPWHTGHISERFSDEADIEGRNLECIADEVRDDNRRFIIHARTDVPELARRLKKAIDELWAVSRFFKYDKLKEVIDSLERTP